MVPAQAGFCAGAYLAAHDYVWESMYEGPGYFNFKYEPPISVFPHTVCRRSAFGHVFGS